LVICWKLEFNGAFRYGIFAAFVYLPYLFLFKKHDDWRL